MNEVKKLIKLSETHKSLEKYACILKAHFNTYAMKYTNSTFDIFEYYKRNHTIDLKVLYCLASSTSIIYKKPTSKSIASLKLIHVKQDDFYAQFAYILEYFLKDEHISAFQEELKLIHTDMVLISKECNLQES